MAEYHSIRDLVKLSINNKQELWQTSPRFSIVPPGITSDAWVLFLYARYELILMGASP